MVHHRRMRRLVVVLLGIVLLSLPVPGRPDGRCDRHCRLRRAHGPPAALVLHPARARPQGRRRRAPDAGECHVACRQQRARPRRGAAPAQGAATPGMDEEVAHRRAEAYRCPGPGLLHATSAAHGEVAGHGRVPARVWRSMVGRSWRKGCPVGRAGLRLVEVNHWDFDGYRRRGQMVVAASVTRNFAGASTEMHARRIPVRSMPWTSTRGRTPTSRAPAWCRTGGGCTAATRGSRGAVGSTRSYACSRATASAGPTAGPTPTTSMRWPVPVGPRCVSCSPPRSAGARSATSRCARPCWPPCTVRRCPTAPRVSGGAGGEAPAPT